MNMLAMIRSNFRQQRQTVVRQVNPRHHAEVHMPTRHKHLNEFLSMNRTLGLIAGITASLLTGVESWADKPKIIVILADDL